MTMDTTKKLIPHLAVIVVIGIGLLLTWNWPDETALFPRVCCFVVIGVGVISLISEFMRGRRHEAEPTDMWVASQLSGDLSLRRVGVVFGWLILFLIGVWALGYEIAAILFVFLFMKINGEQNWGISILFTAVSFGFLMSIFRLLLGIIWPHGALWGSLGL